MRTSTLPVSICVLVALAGCSPAPKTPSPTASSAGLDTPAPSTPGTTQLAPTKTASGPTGSISGKIVPPGHPQPADTLKIYARERDAGTVYSTDISVDATDYSISNIPLGVYNVFAWYSTGGLAGAYTSAKITLAETSSDQFTCTNSLIDITLSTGAADFQGADMACWGGDFFSYFQ